MAKSKSKSKKQRRIEAQDKEDAKKFWVVVGISTVVLMLLLYFMFSNIN